MAETPPLIKAAARLRRVAGNLSFGPPVTHVYNPLDYARKPWEQYLRQWGSGRKRVVFLGMNPGPWGMAQVGVPFGEIGYVRDWIGIELPVGKPADEHPKRPVDGFACRRSEVSGQRLWGCFADRFGTAQAFFREHFVANYCPLMFLDRDGRNVTPDKLRKTDREALQAICDIHLQDVVRVLRAEWLIGVGRFAATRAAEALSGRDVRVGSILHPSPASPAANRGWAPQVVKQLVELGVWR